MAIANSDFLKRLGIEHPIILAPMGGGPSTPELVAAVSDAGGLGVLGSPYMTPDQIKEAVRRIRELTRKPFGANLFVGAYRTDNTVDPAPMLALLSEIHKKLDLPLPTLPALPPDPFPKQLEAVIEARPALFSFTFGIPDRTEISRLKARGIAVVGTATTVEEARMLAAAEIDAIVAQGAEAGAHRGTFTGSFEAALVPTLELVRGVTKAVSLPVIASGGLMDGRDIAAALDAGAVAAQLGTAFLPCPECGASAAYKQAILQARKDATVITRAFSGRPARGLANDFIAKLAGKEDAILPYPIQNALTRTMRNAAGARGEAGLLSLWAGQGVARARQMPASELVKRLVEEMNQALAKA